MFYALCGLDWEWPKAITYIEWLFLDEKEMVHLYSVVRTVPHEMFLWQKEIIPQIYMLSHNALKSCLENYDEESRLSLPVGCVCEVHRTCISGEIN